MKTWTENEIVKFKNTVITIWETVRSFFININNNNLINLFESVEFQFQGSFWNLIEQLNIYKNISEENFIKLLNNENLWIREILHQKRLVNYFGLLIKNYLLNSKSAAELLLTQFEEKHLREYKNLYFPNCLSIKDKESIILKYLENEDANLNYVRLAVNSRESSDLKLSPKTRLKAQKVEREKNNEILEQDNAYSCLHEVAFSEDQLEPVKTTFENDTFRISYSKKIIDLNKDYYSLFKNFSILFKYTDVFGNITLISKDHESDIMEKILMHSKNEYPSSTSFTRKSHFSLMELVLYSDHLKKMNIRIENILFHIITEHFSVNFGLNGLRINFPSKNASNLEKARMIAPELESLIKQYKLFVEDGKIEHELLQISSASMKFKDIPSLVKKKYVYGTGNEFFSLKHLFFSDQTGMFYVKPFEKKYRNFYSLLTKENIRLDNFKNYQKDTIDALIKDGYLFIDSNGFVKIKDQITISMIGRLSVDEVISYWRFSDKIRSTIDKMEENGIVYFGNTLLAEPEQKYFSYYLNKSEFTNGKDLRNRYAHGTNGDSDSEHKHAYYNFLKLLVLLVLKIEDDLIVKNFLFN